MLHAPRPKRVRTPSARQHHTFPRALRDDDSAQQQHQQVSAFDTVHENSSETVGVGAQTAQKPRKDATPTGLPTPTGVTPMGSDEEDDELVRVLHHHPSPPVVMLHDEATRFRSDGAPTPASKRRSSLPSFLVLDDTDHQALTDELTSIFTIDKRLHPTIMMQQPREQQYQHQQHQHGSGKKQPVLRYLDNDTRNNERIVDPAAHEEEHEDEDEVSTDFSVSESTQYSLSYSVSKSVSKSRSQRRQAAVSRSHSPPSGLDDGDEMSLSGHSHDDDDGDHQDVEHDQEHDDPSQAINLFRAGFDAIFERLSPPHRALNPVELDVRFAHLESDIEQARHHTGACIGIFEFSPPPSPFVPERKMADLRQQHRHLAQQHRHYQQQVPHRHTKTFLAVRQSGPTLYSTNAKSSSASASSSSSSSSSSAAARSHQQHQPQHQGKLMSGLPSTVSPSQPQHNSNLAVPGTDAHPQHASSSSPSDSHRITRHSNSARDVMMGATSHGGAGGGGSGKSRDRRCFSDGDTGAPMLPVFYQSAS